MSHGVVNPLKVTPSNPHHLLPHVGQEGDNKGDIEQGDQANWGMQGQEIVVQQIGKLHTAETFSLFLNLPQAVYLLARSRWVDMLSLQLAKASMVGML